MAHGQWKYKIMALHLTQKNLPCFYGVILRKTEILLKKCQTWVNDGEYSLADIAAIMGHSTMTDQVYGKGKRSGGFSASVQAILTPKNTDPKP